MTCTVCHTEYYLQSEIDPEEQCWCGEMVEGGLWKWEGWRGVKKAMRYRLDRSVCDAANYIMTRLVG